MKMLKVSGQEINLHDAFGNYNDDHQGVFGEHIEYLRSGQTQQLG